MMFWMAYGPASGGHQPQCRFEQVFTAHKNGFGLPRLIFLESGVEDNPLGLLMPELGFTLNSRYHVVEDINGLEPRVTWQGYNREISC